MSTATPTNFAQNAQEQTLKSIRQTQQTVIEAVRTWASAVEKTVPETPALPFTDELPTPQEIIKTSFEFAEQLLQTQREFAESLVAAAAPVFVPASPAQKPAQKA
jgi:hypothetical protein